MKSDHRHELKTNELAEWLSHLPQWTKENLSTIIMVCVVIIAGIAIYTWRVYNVNVVRVREHAEFTSLINQLAGAKMQIIQGQDQGGDPSIWLLPPAKGLETFAQSTNNDRMAALALIKQAEALRAEVHYGNNLDKQYVTSQTNKAKHSYTEALQRCPDEPSLAAAAKFGLALCEEELGNFDLARQMYQEIVANAHFEPTVAFTQAKHRLATMADYQQEIVFGPPPKPAASQPVTQIAPPDSGQPKDIIPPFNIYRPLDLDLNFPAAPTPPAEANAPGEN